MNEALKITKQLNLGHCADCEMPIYPLAPVVISKGKKFHPDCKKFDKNSHE